MRETIKASEMKHEASGCACDPTSCEPQESRTQETKRPRVGPRTQVPLAGRVPILSSRNRASPTSVLADEKVMPEKEPTLVLAEEKEIIGVREGSDGIGGRLSLAFNSLSHTLDY